MAASTIGTNVVADEQELANLINKVVSALDNSFKTTKNNYYQKMMERLAKYVGAGGSLSYDLVNQKYVKEIEGILKAKGIDYMLIPTENGDVGIAVKDTDKDILKEAEELVFGLSIDNTKEFHDMDKFIDNMKTNPEMKGLPIPVLSCNDKVIRNLLQQSLYESNIVSCYSENTDKLCVAPNKLFSKDGDLADGLLRASFDIARCEASPEYKTGKIEQLKYDRETLNKFIAYAKGGSERYLTSYNKGAVTNTLKIDERGDIYVMGEKDKGFKKILSAEDIKNFDNTTAYAHLSRFTDEIRDMVILTPEGYNQFRTTDFSRADKVVDFEKTYLIDKKRPPYKGEALKYQAVGREIDEFIKDVIDEANRKMQDVKGINLMSPDKAFNIKRNKIIEILDNENHPLVKEFTDEIKDKNRNLIGLTKAQKLDIVHKAKASIDDVLGNSKDDINIEFTNAKRLEEVFDKSKANEKEAEKGNDNEKESAKEQE